MLERIDNPTIIDVDIEVFDDYVLRNVYYGRWNEYNTKTIVLFEFEIDGDTIWNSVAFDDDFNLQKFILRFHELNDPEIFDEESLDTLVDLSAYNRVLSDWISLEELEGSFGGE